MTKFKQTKHRPLFVAIGLALCAFIVALPPLLLWLATTLNILGYLLLAGFISIFILLARANLGERRSSVFYANKPLKWSSAPLHHRFTPIVSGQTDSKPGIDSNTSRNTRRIGGWKAAYNLDYLGVLTRLKTRGANCSVCSRTVRLSNLGTVYRYQGKSSIVCGRSDCLEIAFRRERESDS